MSAPDEYLPAGYTPPLFESLFDPDARTAPRHTEEQLLERLREIVATREALIEEERRVVKRLREAGYNGTRWDVIGAALGVSRQAVMKKHAQRLADDDSVGWRHRRRWDAGRPRRSYE